MPRKSYRERVAEAEARRGAKLGPWLYKTKALTATGLAAWQAEGWEIMSIAPNTIRGTTFGHVYTLRKANPYWVGQESA